MSSHLPPNPNEQLDFSKASLREICLAGGCFWGTEAFMERVYGVYSAKVGYANGHTDNPTYKEVCTGTTGHAEAVIIQYDAERVSLTTLLEALFTTIDPTSLNKQGGDIGTQYRTGIYYKDEEDKALAVAFIANNTPKYKKPIVVEVLPLNSFYDAEEYHQKYLAKNPGGYCHVDLGTCQGWAGPKA